MEREIKMYMLPLNYPVLKQKEGNNITFDISLKGQKNKQEFVKHYYNMLGNSFNEKFNKIKKKIEDPKLSKEPFFWDHPEIKFLIKE